MAISAFLFSSLMATSTLVAAAPQNDPQEQASRSQTEIIVEGPSEGRERRNELRRLAREVLNKPRFSQSVASYSEPMCPKVFGLPGEAAKAIEARMRSNAIEFGLNHKDFPERCTHNTSVIFVPPSQGKAETWLDYDSEAIDHLYSYERQWVLEEEGPVRAWTYRPARLSSPVIVPSAPSGVANDAQRLALMTNAKRPFYASRLRRDPNPLGGAAVLIELQEADGKSINQLADYASMRTFGNSRALSPEEVPTAQTILTLFQDEDAPQELTDFDRALVSMLYETGSTASRSLVYGNIARRAARLESEEKVEE